MDKICGIDEAGRGPLAGPLVVVGVVLKENIIGLNDSKVLSKKTREKLFEQITNKSRYHIVFSDSKKIDKYGLSYCVKNSIVEIMNNLQNYTKSFLIDGNTNFGINNLQKEIKADAKYPFVSAASILAKVSRDRYMEKIANLYKEYNFEKNKGYGTKQHIDAIKLYGRSDIHRKSFKLKQLNEI